MSNVKFDKFPASWIESLPFQTLFNWGWEKSITRVKSINFLYYSKLFGSVQMTTLQSVTSWLVTWSKHPLINLLLSTTAILNLIKSLSQELLLIDTLMIMTIFHSSEFWSQFRLIRWRTMHFGRLRCESSGRCSLRSWKGPLYQFHEFSDDFFCSAISEHIRKKKRIKKNI